MGQDDNKWFGSKTPLTQSELPSLDSLTDPEIDATEDIDIDPVAVAVVEEAPAVTGEVANVQLAPSSLDKALPEGLHNVGMYGFQVPNAEGQANGFYVKDAGVFVAQFKQFRFIVKKGENAPSVQI